MKRRIKKARIKFISLVPKGANKLPVILKDDGAFEFDLITKASEEQNEILALVYAPEFRDSQGDIASAEVVKEMAYSFQKEGGQLDIRHNNEPIEKDKAFVAETFLVQKGDPRFAGFRDRDGNEIDPEGSWGVVIKVEDPEIWKLYKEGGWGGVSLAGTAEMEAEKEDSEDSSLLHFFKSFFNGERKMTKELKKELDELREEFKTLVEAVKSLQPKQAEKEETKKEEPKVDEEKEALKKELSELKEKLAKFEKASNQDPKEAETAKEEVVGLNLSKEEIDAVARARKVAELLNKQKGL